MKLPAISRTAAAPDASPLRRAKVVSANIDSRKDSANVRIDITLPGFRGRTYRIGLDYEVAGRAVTGFVQRGDNLFLRFITNIKDFFCGDSGCDARNIVLIVTAIRDPLTRLDMRLKEEVPQSQLPFPSPLPWPKSELLAPYFDQIIGIHTNRSRWGSAA